MAQSTHIIIIFFNNNNSHLNTTGKKNEKALSYFFLFSFPQYFWAWQISIELTMDFFLFSIYWCVMVRRAWYFMKKYETPDNAILQKITRLPLSLSRKGKRKCIYKYIWIYIVCIYKDACHSFCHELLLFLNFFFHPDIKFYHLIAYMWEKQPEFML